MLFVFFRREAIPACFFSPNPYCLLMRWLLLPLFCLAIGAQAQSADRGFAGLLLSWLEAENHQSASQLRSLAAREDCADCSRLLAAMDRWDEQIVAAGMSWGSWERRHFAGADSAAVLGTLDWEEALLPLNDFFALSYREYGQSNPSRPMPSPTPGRYSLSDWQRMRAEWRCLMAFRYGELLDLWRDELAAASPQPVLIAPAALRVLYTGVNNPLVVYGGASEPTTVQLKGAGAWRDSLSGQWYARPEKPGSAEIRLEGRDPAGRTVRGSASFEARRVPDPQIFVAGRADGLLMKKEISGASGLAARNEEFFLDAGYAVRGFDLVFTPEYGSPVSAKTAGNKFSEAQLAILQRTKPGDRLLFRVAVEFPDGSVKTLSPTFFVR
jgi:hypothetical protein